jgi:hypothetical protein
MLCRAVALGAVQQSFDITKHNVFQRFQVNEDAQLAIFGLLNTLLALMVRDSLSHIADTVVTKWMISSRGASPLDFEMYEESIKPWIAIANVHTRRKKHGWNLRDGGRFFLCAATGICLLLQGASMNTIGMPKLRWWPDTRFVNPDPNDNRLFFNMPTKRVASVSYMAMWERGWQTVREGGAVSWEIVSTLNPKPDDWLTPYIQGACLDSRNCPRLFSGSTRIFQQACWLDLYFRSNLSP